MYANSGDMLKFLDDDGMPSDKFRMFIDNLKFAAKNAPDELTQTPDERVQIIAIAAHLGVEREEGNDE